MSTSVFLKNVLFNDILITRPMNINIFAILTFIMFNKNGSSVAMKEK